MTEDTQELAGSELERRAAELYETNRAGAGDVPEWVDLDPYLQDAWVRKAQESTPKVARGLNLKSLPPLALEAVKASKVDPRTHHKTAHSAYAKEIGAIVKGVKLLTRPAPEDQEIRRELMERGFTPFGEELVPSDGASVVMEFVYPDVEEDA